MGTVSGGSTGTSPFVQEQGYSLSVEIDVPWRSSGGGFPPGAYTYTVGFTSWDFCAREPDGGTFYHLGDQLLTPPAVEGSFTLPCEANVDTYLFDLPALDFPTACDTAYQECCSLLGPGTTSSGTPDAGGASP
jgi:hypothetical protein